jgi:hypothetical protein
MIQQLPDVMHIIAFFYSVHVSSDGDYSCNIVIHCKFWSNSVVIVVYFQVRITRTVPIAFGSVQRFLLYGDYDGDVYAMGGDVEVRLEPRSLLDEVRTFPMVKIDRSISLQQIKKCIDEEEGR